MNLEDMKMAAAEAALDYIEVGSVIGVGSGSTVNHFIDGLKRVKAKIDGAVSSSAATTELLHQHGIRVLDLGQTWDLPLYVDGADEFTKHLHLTKGGGGALTREKIIAQAGEKFVCIADESKLADTLGGFPVPLEVIPMAQSLIGRCMIRFGGQPELRENFTTDNGNIIIDVRNLKITNPVETERELNQFPGVVTVGIFALRPADVVLLGTAQGVQTLGTSD